MSALLLGCSHALSGLHIQLPDSVTPFANILGYKNHHVLLTLGPKHLSFLLPSQHMKYHVQVTPCHNKREVYLALIFMCEMRDK